MTTRVLRVENKKCQIEIRFFSVRLRISLLFSAGQEGNQRRVSAARLLFCCGLDV